MVFSAIKSFAIAHEWIILALVFKADVNTMVSFFALDSL